jgi:hypothetical protein
MKSRGSLGSSLANLDDNLDGSQRRRNTCAKTIGDKSLPDLSVAFLTSS